MFRDFLAKFYFSKGPFSKVSLFKSLVFARCSFKFLLRLYAMIGICLNIVLQYSSLCKICQCFLIALLRFITVGLYLVTSVSGISLCLKLSDRVLHRLILYFTS